MRTQRHFLPRLAAHDRVLILGGGTGRILTEMLKRGIGRQYVYIDISAKMVVAARKRVTRLAAVARPIEFICGSVESIAGRKFDLIVTPFVLDCFQEAELGLAMRQLNAALIPGGKWLFADFNVPAGLMGFISRSVVRTLYFAFNVLCGLGIKKLAAFDGYFQEMGLSHAAERLFLRGLLVARIYDKMPSK